MGTSRRWLALLAVVAVLLGVTGCSGGDDDSGDGGPSNALTEARDDPDRHAEVADPIETDDLVIEGFAFTVKAPVKQNRAVGVSNRDDADHTVTMDRQPGFDVKVPAGEAEVFLAVHPPGRYPFHCEIHPSMKGTLVIEA